MLLRSVTPCVVSHNININLAFANLTFGSLTLAKLPVGANSTFVILLKNSWRHK